jgi:bifunctional UDP-N-acetylglucosamine pyrophosphorylase / glucosamine-1-phosphate N-acetyltransferase
MRSSLPKVLHRIGGQSMLSHVLGAVQTSGATAVAVVAGPDQGAVTAEVARLAPGAQVFVQSERRGTAHAALCAAPVLDRPVDDVVIVFADTPLVQPETFRALRGALATGSTVAVLGFRPADSAGYGRLVVRDGRLLGIREERDASPEEREIGLCNAGLMALRGDTALAILRKIGSDNAKREFYLTDAVEIANAMGFTATVLEAKEDEVRGVNTRSQLAEAEAVLQRRLRVEAMDAGVTMIAPDTVFLSADTRIGRDVVIEPHVVFGPGVVVEDEAVIHAFCHLEGAHVAKGASVGPFARLRPGTKLGERARIGNFVEVKAAEIGPGAKANHLSYIGDSTVGAGANVGAGTITCNYDGAAKHRTEIGAGAFIGSNSALVAPVTIGEGAYVGSGSVITQNVPPDALAVGRARQVVKEGYAERLRSMQKRPAKAAADAE